MDLYVIRHAPVKRTDENIYGRTDYPAVIPCEGQLDALANRVPAEAEWYSSPRLRAIQTAAAITSHMGFAAVVLQDGLLAEQDYGVMEGGPPPDPLPLPGKPFWPIARTFRPENGESFDDVVERARQFLRKIGASPARDVVAVTHGNFIRGLLAHALDLDADRPAMMEVRPLGLVHLRRSSPERGGGWDVVFD